MIRRKYLRYSGIAKELVESFAEYRKEVKNALERFDRLDFGIVSKQDLRDNTESLANEGGMLIGCYPSVFGLTSIVHNLDFGKTTVVFAGINVTSHFGF